MLVLHGFWSLTRGLSLWAEDSELSVSSRSQALRSARPHPFAAGAGILSDVGAGIGAGQPAEATLLLPSLAKSPLDSPELIRITPRPPAKSEPVLLPWRVPTVNLPAEGALRWLAQFAAETDDERSQDEVADLRHGASIAYLAELAAFAGELTEGGRVLPDVAVDQIGPIARWRPVLEGPDIIAVGQLVAAMPPVCRCEIGPTAAPGSPAETTDAHELAVAALHALTDSAVRQRLPSTLDLLPPRRGRRPQRLPVAETWLLALTGPEARFEAEAADVAALRRHLEPWSDIGTGRVGPARATFRLSEIESQPAAVGDGFDRPGWRLDFLLQSTQDPSLLVPAGQAWSDDGSLRRWLDRPQELLLGELGRASRIYPELVPGLRHPTPSCLELDADGASQFLSTAAPALDQAGFGVLLPSWWDRRRKLGLKASASTPADQNVAGGHFAKEALVDFHWQLAVGDEVLTDDEMAALAETKTPLVRLRGQWVAVDPEQLRRGLEFLRTEPKQTKTAVEVLALAASHPEDLETPLPVTGVRAEGWLGDLLNGASAATLEPVRPPDDFTATLRPYQERGLAWLSFLASLGLGACLADDMGLGKTVQLLAAESVQRTRTPDTGPTLLLCPMSLVGNWQREAAKFAPRLRVYAHHGSGRLHDAGLRDRLGRSDLVLTTYGTGVRDIDELADYDWHRVVLDEAQAIKNSRSRTSRAIHRLQGSHRVALTGTPVENRLSELWSIMDFLNPGMLGSPESFRSRYAIPVERHGEADAAERLRAITRPYILRRLKTDPAIIDDLPDKIEMKEYCRLTLEQASLYQSIVDDMMDKIENSEGIERRGNVLAAMAKLKQVCNHPAQVLHDRSPVGVRSGKVIRLEELLEEILAEGDKVLCFTQFTEFAELLLPHLAARFSTDIAYLHGGTSKKRRDELVESFQSVDGPPIFLLSLMAGGTGLNLTAANHVIHLDRWWNPAVENQATDRAFRIGQRRNLQVRKFICAGTLEEKIDQMITDKLALANLVISDGEGWLTELSTQELREVFTLAEGAVGE